MGTRHLIAVQLDNDYKVAQYGQWDGYPAGQGETVLDFLSKWDRPLFEEKLRAASFATKDELKAVQAEIDARTLGDDWTKEYPEYSRDTGAKILQIIQDRPAGIKLKNQIDFAGDSLFCEWAYVIDLDKDKLDVYKGFNKEPLPAHERFANAPLGREDGEYYQIALKKSYWLDALPTLEQMVADCDPPEIEEEEE